ncbi:hypothetical protein SEA_PHABULOSO_101 [Gordonia phage Phabuloso]|nr:hypothetical protein SEA_PHABULOSO_101 [Gordonia phage Phabuloso]
MSELDLDAIEARANAAYVGPWTADPDSYGDIWARAGHEGATVVVSADPALNAADAEFIAHARTDVPALVSRVRELEALARDWKLAVENCDHEDDGWDCDACLQRTQDGSVLLHVIRNGRAKL